MDTNESGMVCPHCGSGEVGKAGRSQRIFAISTLILGFPLPFFTRAYHCFDCGKDFRNRKLDRAVKKL